MENSKAGYCYINKDGLFRKVNEAWLQMHGYASQDEIVGQHFSVPQVGVDQAQAQEIVDSMLDGATIPPCEFSRRCNDINCYSYCSID